MREVLILGGAGMLGHKLFQVLGPRFGASCTLRGAAPKGIDLFQHGGVIEHVDAADLPAVERLLRERKPAVVVNAVGIVKQRAQAKEAVPSIQINALLPHALAATLAEWDGRLIHFSTDCVFTGSRGHYTEADPTDAQDLYGRTKALGEVASPNALTLRTSIIGRELSSFASLLEWFLAQRGRTVKGFRHAIYAGVTTNWLAELVASLIADHPRLSGLYQVTASPIAKYDLLVMLREAYGLDVTIEPDDNFRCDRSMLGDRFVQATGIATPSWPELVKQLAADPTPYLDWRRELETV